jgi:hypothetical protein
MPAVVPVLPVVDVPLTPPDTVFVPLPLEVVTELLVAVLPDVFTVADVLPDTVETLFEAVVLLPVDFVVVLLFVATLPEVLVVVDTLPETAVLPLTTLLAEAFVDVGTFADAAELLFKALVGAVLLLTGNTTIGFTDPLVLVDPFFTIVTTVLIVFIVLLEPEVVEIPPVPEMLLTTVVEFVMCVLETVDVPVTDADIVFPAESATPGKTTIESNITEANIARYLINSHIGL